MATVRCDVTKSVKRYPTTPAVTCRRRTATRIPRNYRNIETATQNQQKKKRTTDQSTISCTVFSRQVELRSAPKHPKNVMRNMTVPTTMRSRAGSNASVSTTSTFITALKC